jgi:hypothetical protein
MKSKHRDLPILAVGDKERQLADIFFDSATNSFLPLLDYAPSNAFFLHAMDRRFFLLTLAISASIFSLGLWRCSADKSDYKPAMFARRI